MKLSFINATVLLFLPLAVSAQQEFEDTSAVRISLNQMFSNLDKSRIPTGYLLDYSVNLVDLDRYDGNVLVDTNYVNIETFGYIVRAIRSASVTTSSVPSISTVLSNLADNYSDCRNPVGIALFRYNYIRSDALSQSLISYENNTVSDVFNQGIWQNPYADTCVVAFSPLVNVWGQGLSFDYHFDNDCIYTNETINLIEFDPGDGSGFHSLSMPQDVGASYSCPGQYETKLRVTLQNGAIYLAHSPVNIRVPVLPRVSKALPRNRSGNVTTIDTTFSATAYSDTASARISIHYKTNLSSCITKPLVVVEGFDIITPVNAPWGNNSIYSIIDDSNYSSITNNYDIIYIDWNNHLADIRLNALILKAIIQWVNTNKTTIAPIVVWGQSMGGLVARYALCTMSNHQVSAFISHDTPHDGVNFPIGLQNSLSFLLSQINTSAVLSLLDGMGSSYINGITRSQIERLRRSPAIQQMILYKKGNLFYNTINSQQWHSELANLGFPTGTYDLPVVNLSISNGGNGNHSSEPELFSLEANVQIGSIIGAILLFQNIPSGELEFFLQLPGQTNYNLELHSYKALSPSSPYYTISVQYIKKFLWIIPVLFLEHNNSLYPSNYLCLDQHNGSYYDNPSIHLSDTSSVQLVYTHASIITNFNAKFMFVPNYSSLAAGIQNSSVPFWSQTLERLQMTPFDAYYMQNTPSGHISSKSDMGSWLSNQLTLRIIPPDTLRTGAQFSISGSPSSVSWSTSNSSRATVSSNGTLTLHGFSPFTVYATGVSCNNPYRRSHSFEGFMPGYILQDSYNALLEKVTVTASLEDESEAALLAGKTVQYFWGRIMPLSGGTITWTESTQMWYRFYLKQDTHTTVYFKVIVDDLEWVYSIRCWGSEFIIEPPIGLIEVTPTGELIAEDGDGENVIITLKGDSDTARRLHYNVDDFAFFESDHVLSSAEMCGVLLEYSVFLQQLRSLHPWGENNLLIIPYSVIDDDNDISVESTLQFICSNE